jgi:hypothetical protein
VLNLKVFQVLLEQWRRVRSQKHNHWLFQSYVGNSPLQFINCVLVKFAQLLHYLNAVFERHLEIEDQKCDWLDCARFFGEVDDRLFDKLDHVVYSRLAVT